MRIWILILAFLALFSYWKWDRDELSSVSENGEKFSSLSLEVEEPFIQEQEKKKIKSRELILKKPLAQVDSKIKTQKEVPHYKVKSRKDLDFQVVNGWAISFGDVLLGKVQTEAGIQWGLAKATMPSLWKSNVIPYGIDRGLKNPERVLEVIRYFNETTSINFVPIEEGDEDAIVFAPFEDHCASYLGRVGGNQPIFISDKCGFHEISHEIMHALGFIHEHSRNDRDEYIEVVWENIKQGFETQFSYAPDFFMSEYRGREFEFDYESVMLYRPMAFSIDARSPTLKSRTAGQIRIDQKGLSQKDVARIESIYGY